MSPSNDAWGQILTESTASDWNTANLIQHLQCRARELSLADTPVTLGQTFGNRFLLVWHRTGLADQSPAERRFWTEVAQAACSHGLHVDDTLHVAPTDRGHGKYFWVIGGDGRVATHCANGLLLAGWLVTTREAKRAVEFLCGAQTCAVELLSKQLARVNLGAPHLLPRSTNPPASLLTAPSAIHTGEPHAVSFIDELAIAEPPYHDRCLEIGREVCEASPDGGINWNLVLVDGDQLQIRTFERGVRRITQSCGTGSAAAFAIALLQGRISGRPTQVVSAGGAHLLAMRQGQVLLGGRPRAERQLTLGRLLAEADRQPLRVK